MSKFQIIKKMKFYTKNKDHSRLLESTFDPLVISKDELKKNNNANKMQELPCIKS